MRTDTLKNVIFELSASVRDSHHNTIQIFSESGPGIVAVIDTPEGNRRIIRNVKNGLNPDENIISLHNRLLSAPLAQEWAFAVEERKVTIWPCLFAAGWKDAIPSSHEDLTDLTRLARGRTQEEICSWFYTNGYQASSRDPNAQIQMSIGGHHAGLYSIGQNETIRNLLRQGAKIESMKFSDSRPQEGNFIGRGLVFEHERDRSQTTFNVDFTQERTNGQLDREKNGGYHIDVKSAIFGSEGKIKISTQETYAANYEARQEGRKAPYKLLDSYVDRNPAKEQFYEKLQKTGLTESYNANHQDSPAPDEGGQGEIGGVGCSADYIKGLFNSFSSILEVEHAFFIPSISSEEALFSEAELHQVLHELAIGIYPHNTVPFFSLHFSQEGHLYPVIHPAYEKTLIGEVFSMLDYILKGYLNGGIFKPDFVYKWAKNPGPIPINQKTLDEMVNFSIYSEAELQGGDAQYQSLRSLTTQLQQKQIEQQIEEHVGRVAQEMVHNHPVANDDFFRDYTKFSNSCRIIARHDRFEKAGNLFVLNGDFDALYTVEPNSDYKLALEQYYKINGHYPFAYNALVASYQLFMEKIHNHMAKLPMCRKYFSLLNVISFFSSYFMTLKKHYKYPVLPEIKAASVRGSPSLFPSLPLLTTRKETLSVDFNAIKNGILIQHKDAFRNFLLTITDFIIPPNPKLKEEMVATTKRLVAQQLNNTKTLSPTMLRKLNEDPQRYNEIIDQIISKINLFDEISQAFFEQMKYATQHVRPGDYIDKEKSVNSSLSNLQSHLSSENLVPFMKIQQPLFIPPAEQDPNERRQGVTIVGGCGMAITPKTIEHSITGEAIINDVGVQLLQHAPGSLLPFEGATHSEKGFDFVYSPLRAFIRWVCTANTNEFGPEDHYLTGFRNFMTGNHSQLDIASLNSLSDYKQLQQLLLLLQQANAGWTLPLTTARARQYLIEHTEERHHVTIATIEDDRITKWLFSAYQAEFRIHKDVDYVITQAPNRKGVMEQKVDIVNLKTGRISAGNRSSGGTHEFVEVKHGIPVEKESLCPIALSHAVFYAFYTKIIALTGTSERKQTKSIYDIHTFDIPPHNPRQRIDHPVEILPNEESHFARLIILTQELIAAQRPHLILCATIRETQRLAERMQTANISYRLLNDVQKESEATIIKRAGEEGSVTIATNTAGRGTNIVLTEGSLAHGGLNTTLTFFPENERVENQAIGRSGRQGQPGSSRMILQCTQSEVVEAKKQLMLLNHTKQQLIEKLKAIREVQDDQLSASSLALAHFERFAATLVRPFYETYREWSQILKSEDFLDDMSARLNCLRLPQEKEINLDPIFFHDRSIAEQCIQSLKSDKVTPLTWKCLLQSMTERMQTKTIVAWCQNFYDQVEQIKGRRDIMDENKEMLKQLYENQWKTWTKYMTEDPTLGVMIYLKEITTLKMRLPETR